MYGGLDVESCIFILFYMLRYIVHKLILGISIYIHGSYNYNL